MCQRDDSLDACSSSLSSVGIPGIRAGAEGRRASRHLVRTPFVCVLHLPFECGDPCRQLRGHRGASALLMRARRGT
eukprot:12446528-Alexandrium_andersonii.AAC.1